MQPSPIKSIPLADIRSKAPHRPPGYIERCLSMGIVVESDLVLTDAAFEQLKAEFGGVAGGQCLGCGS